MKIIAADTGVFYTYKLLNTHSISQSIRRKNIASSVNNNDKFYL